jgi:hypothetical protein
MCSRGDGWMAERRGLKARLAGASANLKWLSQHVRSPTRPRVGKHPQSLNSNSVFI